MVRVRDVPPDLPVQKRRLGFVKRLIGPWEIGVYVRTKQVSVFSNLSDGFCDIFSDIGYAFARGDWISALANLSLVLLWAGCALSTFIIMIVSNLGEGANYWSPYFCMSMYRWNPHVLTSLTVVCATQITDCFYWLSFLEWFYWISKWTAIWGVFVRPWLKVKISSNYANMTRGCGALYPNGEINHCRR